MALLAVLIFSGRIPGLSSKKAQEITGIVTIWGTLPEDDLNAFMQNYSTNVRTYSLSYKEIPENQFSATLLNALASGTGPDMILAPYQLILEHRDRISPFPVESLPSDQFKNLYVDGSTILLSEKGTLALPVSIEPLMLFYNRTLLSKHGVVNPPVTWDQVIAMAPELTVLDRESNRLIENGVAFGAYNNIPSTKDLLMTLVSQLNQVPVDRQVVSGEEKYRVLANTPITDDSEVFPLSTAARFYTEFSNSQKSTYSWNSLMPNAVDQFISEKLAMYVGYYGDKKNLMEKNSRLDFGVSFLPQAKGYTTSLTGMRMYGIATLKRTVNPLASFTVEGALGGSSYGPVLASIIGGLSPLRSVIASDQTITNDVRQSVLVAKGWYDINSITSSSYVEAMINDIVNGRQTVSDAVLLFVARLSELYPH